MSGMFSSLTTFPERVVRNQMVASVKKQMVDKALTKSWRPVRRYIQAGPAFPRANKRKIQDTETDSLSSMEYTDIDGSETLVSESPTTYSRTLPPLSLPADPSLHSIDQKIIQNIADWDYDAEAEAELIASDSDTFYSYDGEASGQPSSPKNVWKPATLCRLGPEDLESESSAAVVPRPFVLIECTTQLSPPLHHSRRTRSKVVRLPRDSPGTCPIHGCGDCGLCDTSKPFIHPSIFAS